MRRTIIGTFTAAPPTVTVPSSVAADTLEPDGVIVVYDATFADATSGLVASTCTPASGSKFVAGITTVTCAATDKAGNSRSASFVVTVTAKTANGAKRAVLADLRAELALTTGKDPRKRLSDAIGYVESSLVASLWVGSGPLADGNHLDPVNGVKVFDAEKAAVESLMGLKKPSSTVTAAIAKLGVVDEFLARTAINDAVVANSDPGLVSAAGKEMSDAQGDLAKGRTDLAIGHWKAAWRLVTPTSISSAFVYM